MNVPKCMSTQHPDNVESPPHATDEVIKGEGEVQEAKEIFSLGCDEQLWDSEGKDVDRMVVSKLLSNHPDFFNQHRLGRDCFLTLRIPNPAIEGGMRKTLLEALDSIPSSWDVAQQFYGDGEAAPIHEVILPFTTSSQELDLVYNYYLNFVAGKAAQHLYGDFRVSDWIGQLQPARINVIPLIEDLENILSSDEIVGGYIEGKELPYQRVFLARSDPALNYGLVSAELMLKVALQRLAGLEKRHGIPIYTIVGVGSVPFRGHLTPLNLDRAFTEYPSVHTFTVQSAFKYDYPRDAVEAGFKAIREHKTQPPIPVDESRVRKIIDKYSAEYRERLIGLVPIISKLAGLVPQRRDRRLHIGLFGYSRTLDTGQGAETIRLPRAIQFCATLYSIGIPPELLGMAALDAADLSYLTEVYPSWKSDLAAALQFANDDIIGEYLGDTYQSLARKYSQGSDRVHSALTAAVHASIDSQPASHTQRYLAEAAKLRRFLG